MCSHRHTTSIIIKKSYGGGGCHHTHCYTLPFLIFGFGYKHFDMEKEINNSLLGSWIASKDINLTADEARTTFILRLLCNHLRPELGFTDENLDNAISRYKSISNNYLEILMHKYS